MPNRTEVTCSACQTQFKSIIKNQIVYCSNCIKIINKVNEISNKKADPRELIALVTEILSKNKSMANEDFVIFLNRQLRSTISNEKERMKLINRLVKVYA